MNSQTIRLFAISDLHLAFSTPEKEMGDRFEVWKNHTDKIARAWDVMVREDDVVVIPGDISWASRLDDFAKDFEWIQARPGRKLLLKGNHDYWWPTQHKMEEFLPDNVFALYHNSIQIGPFQFVGTRLWETSEYDVTPLIAWRGPAFMDTPEDDRTYVRELQRLKRSVNALPDEQTRLRIGVCHFPPCSPEKPHTRAMQQFRRAGVKHVIFGHLHSMRDDLPPNPFPMVGETKLHLTSCDWLEFSPALIDEVTIETSQQ